MDTSAFPLIRTTVGVTQRPCEATPSLTSSAFSLTEDGKPVTNFTVDALADPDAPVSMAIVVDISGSTTSSLLDAVRAAAGTYIDNLGPSDTAAILSFAEQVRLVQGYTNDKALLHQALDGLRAVGNTVFYDAVAQSTILAGAGTESCRTVLLLTDGEDTTSRLSLAAALSQAQSNGVPILSVGLGPEPRMDILQQFADATGGRAVTNASIDDVRNMVSTFQTRGRSSYVVSYTSNLPPDEASHTLGVKVTAAGKTSESTGKFVARGQALSFDIAGPANTDKLSGRQMIRVGVTGGTAQEVQLLIDDKLQATAKTAPYNFEWDTSRESSGRHAVTIRVVGTTGRTIEKTLPVEVTNSTPLEPPPYLGVVAPIAVLLVVAAIIAAIALSRRQEEAAEEDMEQMAEEPVVVVDSDATLTLTEQAAPPPPPPPPPARLVYVLGGIEHEVEVELETVMGREPTSSVVIPGDLASRRHARIVIEDGQYWLEDLNSLNGTFVNGMAVTRHKLEPDDQIQIGNTTLTFLLESVAPQPAMSGSQT